MSGKFYPFLFRLPEELLSFYYIKTFGQYPGYVFKEEIITKQHLCKGMMKTETKIVITKPEH